MATKIDKDCVQDETADGTDCLICSKAKDKPPPHLRARYKHFNLWKRSASGETDQASLIELPLKKLKATGVEIGRGSYGRVFEVEYGKTRYAAKELHPILLEAASGQGKAKLIAKFLHECQIWSFLHHPRIVEIIGLYYPSKDNLKVPVIVMEKMQLSLKGLVEDYGHLPWNKTMIILNDVCLGLQYLHSRAPPIVHRDLTPNNILLCSHLRAKITDLGVAKTLKATDHDTKAMTQAPGTPGFMPPECLVDNPVYGLPLDIFSFGGVILYTTTQEWPQLSPQMNSGLTSDHELQRRQQYLKKMTGTFESLKPLVISCLEDNPKNRPTVTKVSTEIKEIMRSQDDGDYCIMFGEEEEDNSTESPKQLDELPPNQYERKGQQQPQSQQGEEQQRIALDKLLIQSEDRVQQQQNQEKQEQPMAKEQELEEQEQIVQMPQQPPLIVNEKNLYKVSNTDLKILTDSDDVLVDTESSDEAALQIVSSALSNAAESPPLVPVCVTPTNTDLNYPLYMAKCDFFSEKVECLNFKKGDLLYIINKEEEWWYARAKQSGYEGYIPQSSVIDPNSLDANEWYFQGITRKHAEDLLMQPFNVTGSFLIRNSESTPGDYSLSIKFANKVRHFRIKHSETGYHISNLVFNIIPQLVAHLSESSNSLHISLKKPCLNTIIKPQKASSSSEEAIETWETDRSSIQFVKKLGTGHFSEVWQGKWNATTEIAVKELKPGVVSANEFSQAVALMIQLIHPQIVQLYAVCTQEEPIYIITELMKHGSLLEYLRGDGYSLKLPQLIDMGAQVADGMAYLEMKNYVLGDLAARNVLVTEKLACKVKTITTARVLSDELYNDTKQKFPIKWTAPEATMFSRFTIKSDVWSFGILLYELITYGCPPYPELSNTEALVAIKSGYRLPSPKGCPDQLYNIMRDCWRDNAATRPTFESLHWRMENFYVENKPTHL